jgi:hypothetical protein
MKTISTTLVLMILLTTVTVSAQKTSVGFTAGATFSKVKAKADNISLSSDFKPGFTAGIIIDVPLSTNLSFQPALNYTQKGGTFKEEGETDKMTLNYLEIPLNFIYSTGANQGFFVGAGPALSYGLSGKEKFSDPSIVEPTKIKFGSDDEELKPFEFSANIISGYRFAKGFMLSANYNLGLTSLANADSDEGTLKNSYFAIKVGCLLNGKGK